MTMSARAFCDRLTAIGCECVTGEPMSRHTTFQIGGEADIFATPANDAEIRAVQGLCRETGTPLTVIGNGSNLLVSDGGLRGCVMRLGPQFSDIRLVRDETILCESGASLSAVCQFAQSHGLTGLEFAYGIPGSIGGAVYMNAGAYGGEMRDVVTACRHLSFCGEAGEYEGEALRFGYRQSAYTGGDDCILQVTLRLGHGDPDAISARMNELMRRRKEKQPLMMPSAGSVFKRPDGAYAAELIERCGLKGRSVGGAMVSPVHSGFIVNTGGATRADVARLIAIVQETVLRETGYALECEVKMIG